MNLAGCAKPSLTTQLKDLRSAVLDGRQPVEPAPAAPPPSTTLRKIARVMGRPWASSRAAARDRARRETAATAIVEVGSNLVAARTAQTNSAAVRHLARAGRAVDTLDGLLPGVEVPAKAFAAARSEKLSAARKLSTYLRGELSNLAEALRTEGTTLCKQASESQQVEGLECLAVAELLGFALARKGRAAQVALARVQDEVGTVLDFDREWHSQPGLPFDLVVTLELLQDAELVLGRR